MRADLRQRYKRTTQTVLSNPGFSRAQVAPTEHTSIKALYRATRIQDERREKVTSSPLCREGFEHEDWDTVCETCHRPLFFVRVAEKQLPHGELTVHRCTGCRRALWYASTSTGAVLLRRMAEMALKVAERTAPEPNFAF